MTESALKEKTLEIGGEAILDMSTVSKNSIVFHNFGETARFKVIGLSPRSKRRASGHYLATVEIVDGHRKGKRQDISTNFLKRRPITHEQPVLVGAVS